jgi:membrane-associated phospholipid phosphatase
MLKSLLKSYPVLFFSFVTYIITFSVIILFFDKVSIFYFVNSHYSPFFDQFFYYMTVLGNGWTYTILMLAMLFISYRYSILFFSALFIKTLIVQSMKYWIFPNMLRPHEFFTNLSGMHVVKGVDLLRYYSFPSGHSASVFCAAVLLCLLIKKNNWTIFLIIIAILTGYSRMYLGQHFSVDVFTGSIIGSVTAYLCFWFIVLKPSTKLNKITWIDKKISISKVT